MTVPVTASYLELKANGTTTVKGSQGFLSRIIVNNAGSAWTMQIFDNTSAAVPAIAGATAFTVPAAGSTMAFECNFFTGLTIVLAGTTAGSITVVFA